VDKEANIARGAPQHKPKGEFDPPWVYILADASAKLKAYLLWQQTFATPSSLAFNVVPFDRSSRSWVIMNLSGDPIANDIKAMHNALGAIKGTLWKSEDFRRITNQCLAAADVGGSASQRAFMVTQTYDLRYSDHMQGETPHHNGFSWESLSLLIQRFTSSTSGSSGTSLGYTNSMSAKYGWTAYGANPMATLPTAAPSQPLMTG
jgi:hypothetical protein